MKDGNFCCYVDTKETNTESIQRKNTFIERSTSFFVKKVEKRTNRAIDHILVRVLN